MERTQTDEVFVVGLEVNAFAAYKGG